ncbi:MAG TPA: WYL domain-containing protein [Ornithinimicrobium sp.]|uniref:helix-turn-helix transcriptional regulator n=1 Tax=Ornithinimicrobium sp. TaxID=1977084 RepID=UPI002B49464D|nr:WYL domain-containing protein [Ornithinimicrobium sp.]HKJ12502.1 WYL domain-containing protein [Ornithinimicrobium sp.]
MPARTPASAKTERLLNLVIALLYTRQPLSKARLRSAVPQYQSSGDEAFDRMFERDKDELRALGIPLRTEVIDPFFDDEAGYRIDRREYELPPIDFAADEVAVIGVASRAWSQASLAGPAAQALRKLQAAGVEADAASVAGIEPLLHTTEPAFDAVRTATVGGRTVRFSYRRSGARDEEPRHVHPWALTSWHGRWYLTGYDLDRSAPRVFRLDRVTSTVVTERAAQDSALLPPADHDPHTMITAAYSGQDPEPAPVTVQLRPGTAYSLRRRASRLQAGSHEEGEWDTATFTGLSHTALVSELAGLGPDARVMEPAEVRQAVRSRLRAVLDGHGQGSSW